MLTLTITEIRDDGSKDLGSIKLPIVLELEHSLVSLSKWESFYEKPFLADDKRTVEEILYYVECMALNKVPSVVFSNLSTANIEAVQEYIAKRHTATWFVDQAPSSSGFGGGETITAEIIYYWMVALGIPFTCETWNINRLITLIRVINLKNQPPKKMSRAEAAARMTELNKQRQEQYGTSG